ncbi:MAG TPA: hypothetical protein VFE33_35435 [Thermoanaerobaculia bacterium]|nr:hypothetical protein [Thermoanaerobaculia bacterium]
MTDPTRPASPPSPFQPRPAGPRPGGGGCSKPALLGCGAFLVLLGIGAVIFVVKSTDIARWWFHKVEAQVATQLPPDLPAADRERLHAAFAGLDRGLASGKLDPAGLQQLQTQLGQVIGKPNRQLTRQDVAGLTAALERLAGKTSASPATPPGP